MWLTYNHNFKFFTRGDLQITSKLALEGAVEDGGEQGVEFGGGFGLEAIYGVHLGFHFS